ncbi:hypothetical protein CCACVL1_26557 [Corchorus capsularis]|uniref:Uncharacterized protein n=1 Tax=Corchorus capsularis TaxID=210143 RepID=A0A1R3GEE1_COCAP|nr:hypothetical protein CCACVL1_26557 [Corchorus capsularis]
MAVAVANWLFCSLVERKRLRKLGLRHRLPKPWIGIVEIKLRKIKSSKLKENREESSLIEEMFRRSRIGVISGKAIFGPPLDEYWRKKLQEEAAAKENDTNST